MTDTYVDVVDTVALLIKIGDGMTPEVFTHPCLINTSRGFSVTANATATEIANCTDPTKPMKTVRKITSFDSSISGDGTLPGASAKTYFDWLKSGVPKNVTVSVGSATGDLVVVGSFVLTSFQLTGSKLGEMVTVSIKLDQADDITGSAHA